jgi:hypothetical protein
LAKAPNLGDSIGGLARLDLYLIIFLKYSAHLTKYTKHWQALAWIFLYLAIDEMCSIHELLIPILNIQL